jgi:hypothetical protein
MSKFCHNCGKGLAIENSKFCPECGAPIAIQDKQVSAEPPRKAIKVIQPVESEADDEIISDKPALSYKELGNKLEEFTARVLQVEGWSTDLQIRDHLDSGARAEFDIIATKKQKDRVLTRIVECKNYNSAVGREKIDAFAKKIESYGSAKNPTALFVAINFSSDARKEADYENVILWDGNDLKEKMFAIEIGRYNKQVNNLKFSYALPLLIDYINITNLDLDNYDKVSVSNAKVYWRPFYKIVYSLFVSKADPRGKPHNVADTGVCIVDAQDGMVLNLPVPKEKDPLFDLPDITFKDSEEDLFVKELESIPEYDYTIQISPDYQMVKLEPKITKRLAKDSAIRSIIYKNTKTFEYEVNSQRKDDTIFDLPDTRKFTIIPKKADITIKESLLVYVPKWDVEFFSGDQIYRKEVIGYKGTVISDTIKHCPKHKILGKFDFVKKENIAVCEVCGKALCKDHVFKCPICNKWFCEEHSVKCVTCGAHYCSEHIGKCADCDSPLCDACAKKCPICDEIHCKKHWVKCDKCGTEVCSSCISSKSGMLFKKYICKKCSP